jgi:hypothetical protein
MDAFYARFVICVIRFTLGWLRKGILGNRIFKVGMRFAATAGLIAGFDIALITCPK